MAANWRKRRQDTLQEQLSVRTYAAGASAGRVLDFRLTSPIHRNRFLRQQTNGHLPRRATKHLPLFLYSKQPDCLPADPSNQTQHLPSSLLPSPQNGSNWLLKLQDEAGRAEDASWGQSQAAAENYLVGGRWRRRAGWVNWKGAGSWGEAGARARGVWRGAGARMICFFDLLLKINYQLY